MEDFRASRLQEPKGSVTQFNGQGLGLPIINVPQGMKVFLEAPRSRDSRDNGLLGTCRSIGLKVPRA